MRGPWSRRVVVTAILAPAAASVTLAQSDESTVRLGGLPVIAVGVTADESASERAARIQRRLERLADRPADGVSPIVARVADGTRIVPCALAALPVPNPDVRRVVVSNAPRSVAADPDRVIGSS